MLRRHLLITTALFPVACSTATPTQSPWQSVSFDVTLLVSGLKIILPYIVTPATAARYNGYIDDVARVAKALLEVQDANSAKSLVQQALVDVQTILANIPSSIPLPQVVQTAIAAIVALMPVIEAAVGLLIPQAGLRRAVRPMTPEQARAFLRSLR